MDSADFYIHEDYNEQNNNKNKNKFINKFIIFFFAFLVLIIIMLIIMIIASSNNVKDPSLSKITGDAVSKYKNNNRNNPNTTIIEHGGTNVTHILNNKTNQSPQQPIIKKTHTPVKLGPNDVLVSFRIDDITFYKSNKPILENALYLARKYNITFDLAVVSLLFDQYKDNETYQIYLDNQDVFEIVAHGLNHKRYNNDTNCGEFKCAPPDIQEIHIKLMKEIFEKYNLYWGTKIFILPWNSGDEKTIEIANKYGYKFMTQIYVPNKSIEYIYINNNKNTIVSKDWITINMKENVTNEEILQYKKILYKSIQLNQTKIQIATHPINFKKIEDSDSLLNELVNNNNYKSKIKFSMISDRFFN